MQITGQKNRMLRPITSQETMQIGGGQLFGEWVGRIGVWTAGGGAGFFLDMASGGAISAAAGREVSRFEDWVNGR